MAVAVAKAGGFSSDLTPSLETSICRGSVPIKGKKTKNETNKKTAKLFSKVAIPLCIPNSSV